MLPRPPRVAPALALLCASALALPGCATSLVLNAATWPLPEPCADTPGATDTPVPASRALILLFPAAVVWDLAFSPMELLTRPLWEPLMPPSWSSPWPV